MSLPLIINAGRAARLTLTTNARAAGSIAAARESGNNLIRTLTQDGITRLPLETRVEIVLEEFSTFENGVNAAFRATGVANEMAVMGGIEKAAEFTARSHQSIERAIAKIGTIQRGLGSGQGFLAEEFNLAMMELGMAHRENQVAAKILERMVQSGEIPVVLGAVKQTDTLVLEAIDASQAVTIATREVVQTKEAYEMAKVAVAAGHIEPSMISMMEQAVAGSEAALRTVEAEAARKLVQATRAVEAERRLLSSVTPIIPANTESETPKEILTTEPVTMKEVIASTLSLDANRAGIIDPFLKVMHPYDNPSAAEMVGAAINTGMLVVPVNAVDEIVHYGGPGMTGIFPATAAVVNVLEATANMISPPTIKETPEEAAARRLALDPGFRRDVEREIEIQQKKAAHESDIQAKVEAQKETERIRDRDANIKDQRAKQAQKRQDKMWKELEEKAGTTLEKNKSLVDLDAEFLGQSIDPTLDATELTPAELVKVSQSSGPSMSVG